MAAFTLLLMLLAILQADASDLDIAFKTFLTLPLTSKLDQENSAVVQNLFKLYNKEFKRLSMTPSEEKIRYAAFHDTVVTLHKAHQQDGRTYTIGLNKYADWTSKELSQLAGVRVPKDAISFTNPKTNQRLLAPHETEIQSKLSSVLPSSYDLTTIYVPGTVTSIIRSVKDQGNCGSCYAFAFVALLETQYAFKSNSGTDLSEQQMIDCSTFDDGCNGGYFINTWYYLLNNGGQVASNISYPYTAIASSSCAFKSVANGGMNFGSSLSAYYLINNAPTMQQVLFSNEPLWVSLFVGNATTTYNSILQTFYSYTGGVLKLTGCPTAVTDTNHAVVIVGYGVDANNIPYWKVKNSWGSDWGEQGYFRIQRGVNMCGIESTTFYMTSSA